MKLRHHRNSSATLRGTAAALLTCVLSLLVTPVALAEPFEGDLLGSDTATTDRGWEHRNDLEFLNQHDEAAQPSAIGNAATKWPQSRVQDLVGQEEGARADVASGSEPAANSGDGESSQPWLVGIGLVATVAVASIILAIVRSRRQEAPALRDRDKLQV
jgi:hypothetical protein